MIYRYFPLAVISEIVGAMGGDGLEVDGAEIRRMQDGMRAALMRAAQGSGRGLRALSSRALLSLLCAGSLAPLIQDGAGSKKASPLGALRF